MQTNSYRLIKWALAAGVAASFATACVVSEGDGNGDGTNLGEGGDSGTTKGGKGGGTSTAGKATGGNTSQAGDTSTAGTPDTGEGGAGGGGGAPGFVPGTCDGAAVGEEVQPTLLENCDPVDTDSECIKCIKLKTDTCTAYKTCFGEEPTSACAVGATADELGQFECVTKCYKDNVDGLLNASELLGDCSASCINQCTIDTVNQDTSNLIGAANEAATCRTECFPF